MRYRSLAPLLKLAAAALAVLLLFDALLFRSGLYYRWVAPDSTAGSVVRAQVTIGHDYRPDRRNVLVLGNSRIGEGFSAPLADAASASGDLHFINGSIAGTTPRVWDYLLRAIDPDADRFAAIAMMVDYDIGETRLDMTNYVLDTPYLLPLLRIADLPSYPASFTDSEQRQRARRGILLPLQALHDDVLDLLAHPIQRRHIVRSSRRGAALWAAQYPGRDEVLPSLTLGADGEPIDWGADAAHLKPRLEGYFHDLREKPPAAMQAENATYLREWLGRIAARYTSHHVPVITFVVPRGPWHGERAPVPVVDGPVAELAARGSIIALPGDAFVTLERPQFFFDAWHMNRSGRERFSTMLAQDIGARVH